MANRKVACIVSTPYHVLTIDNILSMPEYEKSEVDIYIIGSEIRAQVAHLKSNTNVGEILDYSKLFVKKFTRLKRIRVFRSISMVNNIFHYKQRMHQYGVIRVYEEVLIPYPSIPVQVIVYYLKGINNSLIVNSFEDGIGTYLFGSLRHKITHYVFLLSFHFDIWKLINMVYVYRPDLVINSKQKNKLCLVKINPQSHNKYACELLKEHSEEVKAFDDVRVIFFDQYMMGDYPEQLKKEIEIVTEICKIFGEKNVILKIHPRTPIDKLPIKGISTSMSRLPFEILMQEMDLNNVILISPCSTACLTPKILLNEEPNIALISTIMGEQLGTNWDILVNNVRSLYLHKTRFVVPSTVEELLSWLKEKI